MAAPAPRTRTAHDLALSVVVGGVEHDISVRWMDLGQARADAVVEAIVAAVPASAGVALVVERSGTPLWGAAAGGDLLAGDRLVPAGDRALPLLLAVDGPLAGAAEVLDGPVEIGRGRPFGGRMVDDEQVSRRHVRIEPLPHTVRVEDLEATNGVERNGVRVDGVGDLRPGDVVTVGRSRLVLIGDPPPAPGRLTERGRVFIRPERAPLDAPWPDLTEVVSAVVARRPPVWSVVPGHPHYLALPVAPGIDGVPVTAALARHRPIAVIGSREAVEPVVSAWLLRLAALHGPARFRLRVDAAPDGLLWGVRQAAHWLPHNVDHRPSRPAWEHLPTLRIVEPGAAPLPRGRTGDLWLWVSRSARALPVGVEVVATVDDESPGPETLPVRSFSVVSRCLASLFPTIPAEPYPEPIGEPGAELAAGSDPA